VRDISPFTVGALIALFERAVGLYVFLVNVNAYNQPAVEAGKKAAVAVLELQKKMLEQIASAGCKSMTADEIATAIGATEDVEHVFKFCEHLASNSSHELIKLPSKTVTDTEYQKA
jgi:glucose-6-phosphate isomerase